MPKKTKREKIIAAYHKKLKLLQLQNKIIPNSVEISTEKNTLIPISNTINQASTFSIKNNFENITEDETISKYFKKDFTKSSIIISIIILLEFSLYFASINHNLGFF